MDAPIAPRAMAGPSEGPVYDLIALALVTLTLCPLSVWVTNWFSTPGPGLEQFREFKQSLSMSVTRDRLRAARWADLHLHQADSPAISPDFRDCLRPALAMEAREIEWLRKDARETNPDLAARAEARAILARYDREGPPAATYAKRWAATRSEWIESLEAERFRVSAHLELHQFLTELGMLAEADRQLELARRIRPDMAVPAGAPAKVIVR
jgi:hypothetical protein